MLLMGIIKRSFIHICRNFYYFISITSLSHLEIEYANNVRYPKRKTDVGRTVIG